MSAIGEMTWVIAEGRIPPSSTGPEEVLSHEAACTARARLDSWQSANALSTIADAR